MTQATKAAQGELPKLSRRYGIIEIGTRGIRLLVADASPAGIQRIIFSAGDLSYLGDETDASGFIPPSAIKRIKRIIESYLELAEQNEADDVLAIATDSVRVAPNRTQFENEIGQIVPLKVFGTDNEAAFSFLASCEAFKRELAPGSTMLVLDQGGGSTELIGGYLRYDGLPVVKATLDLDFGSIALARIFVGSPSADAAWARINQRLSQGLEAGDHDLKFADLLQRPPDLAIALGSAITSYARDEIASIEGRKPAMRDLHGRSVDPGEILRYLGRIQPTLDKMKLQPSAFSPDSDEATVLSGLVIYGAIAQEFGIKEYRISRSGMRYGVLAWRAGKRVLLELDGDADGAAHETEPTSAS